MIWARPACLLEEWRIATSFRSGLHGPCSFYAFFRMLMLRFCREPVTELWQHNKGKKGCSPMEMMGIHFVLPCREETDSECSGEFLITLL